jgi:hypothetical protein
MNVTRTSMDLAFLARVRRTSAIAGAVAAILVAVYWGPWIAAGWLAGVAWSLVNLYFIGEVIRGVITAEERDTMKLIVVLAIKFPVLYALGFLLLWLEQLPVAALVAGFSWPFAVMVLKAFGRVYMGLDETRSKERSNGEGKTSQA